MGRRYKLLRALCAASLLVASPAMWRNANAQNATCIRGDFVAVVDDAATALRELNQQNKAKFQERLRELKAKHGWNSDQYLKGAEPYVRDETIRQYDQASTKLLGEIAELGQEGSESAQPDCAVLADLRARMDVLVKTQEAKWVYMFEKIDKALAQ